MNMLSALAAAVSLSVIAAHTASAGVCSQNACSTRLMGVVSSGASPGSQPVAGARVVIEEFLQGEEASFMVLCDGKNVTTLATSQDHKRLMDGDQGPNTGGMGAYSPAPIVTPELHARVMREIILPTVQGMAKEGIPYTGFLYAGLMIDAQGNPKTLEFNCRMGDPETQPIMVRLKTDLVKVMEHAVEGTLDQIELEWDRRTALGVVMAAANYPESPRKGDVIKAGTLQSDDIFSGGEVHDVLLECRGVPGSRN